MRSRAASEPASGVPWASADEVLVSSAVKDLVAGSVLSFENRGTRILKDVSSEWPLYAVAGDNGR